MRMGHAKWVLVAGLLAGGVKAYRSQEDLRAWLQRHEFRAEGLDLALPSEVYLVETNRWLEFQIPKDVPLVRLISNASLPTSLPVSEGSQWPYAVEYQFRDWRGRTNAAGAYHFKGERLMFQDRATGKQVEVNSYMDRYLMPLCGRQWMMNLKEPALSTARVLRLRLQSSHPDIPMVSVRVYFQTEVPEHKLGYLWDRLSEEQKRDLARGNVYGYEGLSRQERLNLLRYHWAVAPPEGVPGRDFLRRTLYVRADTETMNEVKSWVPAGIPLDAEHRGVLAITNLPGLCRLQFTDYAPTSSVQVISNQTWWHAVEQARLETNGFAWSGTNGTYTVTNRDGLLEISSSRAVYVRAFQVEAGVTNEITPAPTHQVAFTITATNDVAYEVEHVRGEPTLFRLEVRRVPLSPDPASPAKGQMRYALLDGGGQVWQGSEVSLTNAFSAYDWLVTTNGLTNITEPQSLCFILPAAIRKVRVSTPADPVFVNAYSRPSRLVKTVRVPEDYKPERALAPEAPSWFTLRPRDYVQRREAGQTVLFQVQARLPEYDPLVLAGQYEWDAFLPEPQPRGHMILLPPTEGQPPRPDSAGFSFYPVETGNLQKICLKNDPWQPQVAPSLVLIPSHDGPVATRVVLDGQTLLDQRLLDPVTELRLGDLKPGEHTLALHAATPISAYLNYYESTNNAAYLQRFCILVDRNKFVFPYVKAQADTEVLVLRVFSPIGAGKPEPFRVHLKLQSPTPRGVGPFSELTFLEREARVIPSGTGRTWVVAATPARLDDGQPLFLPLGPDLPPGAYTVEVEVSGDSPRWLSLSRTTPGLAEKLVLGMDHRFL
jgi:hypothetical protein